MTIPIPAPPPLASFQLGWIDVRAMGAVGDGVTDDAPAFQAAINAAISSASLLANRFATVYVPGLRAGGSYRIATPVSAAIVQGGAGASGSMRIRIVGNGMDGPLQIAVGAGLVGFSVTSSLMEWMQIIVDDLTFIPGNGTYTTPGSLVGPVNAKHIAEFGTSSHLGQTVLRNVRTVGTYASDSILHLTGGNVHLENYQSDGDSVAGGAAPALVLSDGVTTLLVNKAYSYGEFRLGDRLRNGSGVLLGGPVDYAGGGAESFFRIFAADPAGERTRVRLNSINQDGNRNTYAVLQNAEHRLGSIEISDSNVTLNTYGLWINNADSVWIRNTTFEMGAKRAILQAINVGDAHVQSCSSTSLGVVLADSTTGLLEVSDCDLGPDTNSPSGVTSDAAATFVETLGQRSRLRLSQAAIVAGTLVKAGATDGRVDQLATGDSPKLTCGLALDAASGSAQYVRSVEVPGQVVALKSDGAGVLAPGDLVTSSGASAGRGKKATAGNVVVARSLSTVAAVADAPITGLLLTTLGVA